MPALLCQRGLFFFFALFFFLNIFGSLNAAERHIALLVKRGFRGELAFAYRIQAACRNILWKADVIDFHNSHELHAKPYDFVISLSPDVYEHPECKNYLAVFHPKHHFFSEVGSLMNKYLDYDGYLLTYNPSELADSNLPSPFMAWYPCAQRMEYRAVNPTQLFHICCNWGKRRYDEKFQQLFSLLEQSGFARFYGKEIFRDLYPASYQGAIPFNDESLYDHMAQAGVALVLHSPDHNEFGLPSGRIFEAAASSCVIICDQNAFVKDHFGETVLYVNTDLEGGSIFRQIQEHMKWIWGHKKEALELARKAHAICKSKYLLEDQLLRLEAFHTRLSRQEG